MFCFHKFHDLFIIFLDQDVEEIRGVGLQVSRLESADSYKQGICVLHRIWFTGGELWFHKIWLKSNYVIVAFHFLYLVDYFWYVSYGQINWLHGFEGFGQNSLKSWLISTSASLDESHISIGVAREKAVEGNLNSFFFFPLSYVYSSWEFVMELLSVQRISECCNIWCTQSKPICSIRFHLKSSLDVIFPPCRNILIGWILEHS